MPSGRISCELALISILCVISIFLFPIPQGPYCAIHGPVTALQSVRSAVRLRLAMVAAALGASKLLLGGLAVLCAAMFLSAACFSPQDVGSASILRC
jgi:hypothetical protein